jgi:hypothetical protein
MPGMSGAEVHLPGSMAQAIAVACGEFARTGFEIERFTVIAASHADEFEVTFVPQQDPGHETLGGSTSAGRETHYWITKADPRVARTSYGR